MKGLPKVLLVEDTFSLALVYREYLKDEPLELTHMVTGKAAMEVIAAAPPHLVLLDLKLPDMDGQEILHWIQSEGFPTAVVVITAHGSVDVAVHVMRAGAQALPALESEERAGSRVTGWHYCHPAP